MAGKGSKHGANSMGKSGNDSGSDRMQARGRPGRAGSGGKHPPNQLFKSPQTQKKARSRVRAGYSSRQSNQG